MTRFKILYLAYGKVLSLSIAMIVGVLLPQIHVMAFLVRYLLMVMLFFAFLDLRIQLKNFGPGVWRVLLANIVIAFLTYGVISLFNHDLAVAGFLTGISPTATASPVLISFIGGQVPFVV
ncbi:MAG: hypothetical protein EHM70_12615, partial [Chloroflexota bacterium]